ARIHDVVIEAERTELHERELKQMEGNAGSFLQFARARLYYMAPDRLRMEGRRGLIPVTVVVNGNIQVVRFGPGIKNRRDLSDAIRRKPTGLEFGLLSGDVWQDYTVTEIGSEEWEGRPAILLHLQVRGERPDSSFQKVWVDRE